MIKIISEINSTPKNDNYYEEINFKENFKIENNLQNNENFFIYFENFIKSDIESEELNENFEIIKLENNFSNKYNKESNNKSEIIRQKKESKNEEKNFLDLKSMVNIYKSEKSNLDYVLTDNIEKLFNNFNEKIVKLKQNETKENNEKREQKIIIGKINDIKENGKKQFFFIVKKRNIFKVVNPNKFYIFNCGNKDKIVRKFINETLKKKKFIILEKMAKSKKIPYQHVRKYNADNIRKKIKARFLKYLKNNINERLKRAGSKYFFTFLPQNFICNVGKNINRGALNLTLEEVFTKILYEKEKEINSALEKYNHNQKVLNYLKNNKIFSESSNFHIFKDIKFYEIYYEYLKSNEFEIEINRLKSKEDFEYIKLYIQLADNLINFFLKE